ncbi:hypothetical protein OE88DRAFT_1680523 [Heliocybe sulcata]|uniref:FAD-binding PCMH-type domain-containing protein n=1 Tax=Heliocybe sulcata TaxID=5364 RepID=A0A5C3MZV2_9AGAM|nr:hypothetical protein OE88DRAFT_1680523 [Heliocybe sulcata]
MQHDVDGWYNELCESVRGQVHSRGESGFQIRSQIFNGNITCSAKAVACPLDAHDVSSILKICNKYSLSPSVKAGGFGTAGWAVNGDIIVDLSSLLDIHIAAPLSDTSPDYVSISDMPVPSTKGKSTSAPPNTLKRARPDDPDAPPYENPARKQRNYDHASPALATFLNGPPLPPSLLGEEPRSLPQDIRHAPAMRLRQLSDESSTSSGSASGSSVVASSSGETHLTSPDMGASPGKTSDPFGYMDTSSEPASRLPLNASADPFGYMSSPLPSPGSSLFSSAPSWAPPPPPSAPPISLPSSSSSAPTPTSDPALTSPLHRASQITHLAHAVPIHPHAYVTFGAGVLQKDLDAFTHAHPLPGRSVNDVPVTVPYHVPSAAHPVGSSIMILGGFGFLSRLHGLSVDNVVEMEVVLADGSIIVASQDTHPDLWWALRGAGPAFGIVTRYKAKAYPVPVVFAGNLIYRFHRPTAPSLIRHFRDCIKSAPRTLYANLLLTAGPATLDSLIVIQLCFLGPRSRGLEFLHAIESWEGEPCLLNEVCEKAFVDQQDSVAQVLRARDNIPAGRNWFIRSALISSLPDDIINKTVLQFADTPIGCTWLFELAGGAITDVSDTCIPPTRREATWTVASLHQWDLEIDDPRCRVSAENWINKTLSPVSLGGSFPSFLGRHEPAARTISCYGDSWPRLAELKRRYDSQNMFRNSFWPLGEGGVHIDPEMHEPASPVIGPPTGHILGSA